MNDMTGNNILTSSPWAVKLSWLENAYSHPLFSAGDLHQ